MSFVDASTQGGSPMSALAGPSPLRGMGDDAFDGADDPQTEDQDDDRIPLEREDNGTLKERLIAQVDDINLARYIPTDELRRIGMQVVEEYRLDENSRADWVQKAQKAMDFALQKTQEKQFPWPRASNIIFPLMAQAAIAFNARTYPALIQQKNVVKGVVWGSDDGTPVMQGNEPKLDPPPQGAPPGTPGQPVWLLAPGEKRQRADRVGDHMSYQLLVEMPYWEPQTDQLLTQLPIVGGAARKTFRDTVDQKNASYFTSLIDLVWDYKASSFEAAPRHTEKLTKYPHEITELERAGITDDGQEGCWLHYEYGVAGGSDVQTGFDRDSENNPSADPEAPHLFLEQHRRLDLDGDGYPEPYVITVHERSNNVVRIVARYDEDGVSATPDGETILKIEPADLYTLIPFLPNIDGGSYPMGFAHLLKPLNEGINTVLNQMIDAGTLQNAGGGFIGSQLGIASGQVSFEVGRYKRVDNRGTDIRANVLPLEFPGPSATLFQLLGVLLNAGKEMAAIQDILAGDAKIANAPPTTVLALIEQGLTVYTAIHKRIYRAFKSEYDKLFKLNRKYIKESQKYQVGDEERDIHPHDYRTGGGVEPMADPTMVTDMQKLARANILMTLRQDPLLDGQAIMLRFLEAANIERPQDLFSKPNPIAPLMAQIAVAKAQAELGEMRASALKDQTQAFLNLALARKNATASEEAQISAQLDFLRLTIESVNAQVRAAAVDAQVHATNIRALTDHMRQTSAMAASQLAAHGSGEPGTAPPPDIGQIYQELGGSLPLGQSPPQAQPGPSGPFPQATVAPPPGPDIVGPGSKGAGTPPQE